MNKEFIYQVDDKDYLVVVTYKRIRNIHFRFDGEKFLVSAPRLVLLKQIKSGLDKYAKKLIKRSVKTNAITDEYIYILGKKTDLTYPGYLSLDESLISYKDEKQLQSKLRKWFLEYVTKRTEFYEKVMGTTHYIVKVRNMKSRYGSNNRQSKAITYSLVLLHYSPDIIDSVIIHELAHHFVYNHGSNFYKVVYKYCPNYDMLRKKLIKAEFE